MFMKSKTIRFFLFLLLGAVLTTSQAFAEGAGGENGTSGINKSNGQPIRAFLNINNISTLIKNDGISDIDAAQANSGLIYPRGSGKAAIYISGLLWGARIDGDPQVRVGGSAYRTGLKPGKIVGSTGNWSAEDPDLPKNRIYRVRPDVIPDNGPRSETYRVPDLTGYAFEENNSATAILAQYYTDWNEWPATDGAPYNDVDGDGSYNPAVDIPGFPGADQTIWYVANDLDKDQANFLYGTDPLGVEMQATFWAYAQQGALGNMFFRKYTLINKSDNTFKDMYVSMFSDPDVGNSVDDFAGCDTELSLGYAYNANASDPTYSPLPPPAAGFDFFQGPVVDGVAGQDLNNNGIDDASDFAISNGKKIAGKVNLPMTAYYYFARGDAAVTDPTQGDPQGSTQFYRFFQGKIGISGETFVDPNTGLQTTFALSGDPQTRTGWTDGQLLPAGDRRIGMASGPFNMAPGDTQEVVVAEIVAGAQPGVDRLAAVGLLKFYDKQAQLAYDNFFDLPVPPPAPEVKVVELDKEIVLDWSQNADAISATENSDEKGFKFQGYNVYQLPSASASISEAKRIATYDINDGFGKIEDEFFDPNTGVVATGVIQFGNDTGIKRFISIKNDDINGGIPLVNGNRYYFAVTAYSYNSADPVPNNLENPLTVYTVVPSSNNPGIRVDDTGDMYTVNHESGLADGQVEVVVVDPTSLTGHDYEITFGQASYSRDETGWHLVASANGANDPDDLTGSTLMPAPVWGPDGTVNIHFTLDLQSPDYDYSDGVQLTFPAGVKINGAGDNEGTHGTMTPNINGQVITWGAPDTSEDGNYAGGEVFSVNVDKYTAAFNVDYIIWDDGWATGYGNPYDTLGNGIVHAQGTAAVTATIGDDFKTENVWNLRDVTTNEIKLPNMTLLGGIQLYGKELIAPNGQYEQVDYGVAASPTVDGFQINLNVNYTAPVDFSNVTLTGEGTYNIGSYGASGFSATSKSIDAFGQGTTDIVELQKDYELRWTGEWETVPASFGNVQKIKDGTGSVATIYGSRLYSFGDHPLNPNPGSTDAFTIRIPFEIWNVDDNQQVNVVFYDRENTIPPAAGDFYTWNPAGRMYVDILNTPYKETVADVNGAEMDNLTWNLIFWQTEFVAGDVTSIQYDNPIVFGTDKFSFKTQAPTYDASLAKTDVNMINVYPNPYYAVNTEEINKYNRFVTFTHLPNKAVIRIFNLAGVLVNTIEKDDNSQFQRWDLANENGLPVASGLYIAYIEMPDLGETKILKVAIIQEQQILDRF